MRTAPDQGDLARGPFSRVAAAVNGAQWSPYPFVAGEFHLEPLPRALLADPPGFTSTLDSDENRSAEPNGVKVPFGLCRPHLNRVATDFRLGGSPLPLPQKAVVTYARPTKP
ncbi:hypothetical protein STSO111631_05695 [Stackebrandtia soli]